MLEISFTKATMAAILSFGALTTNVEAQDLSIVVTPIRSHMTNTVNYWTIREVQPEKVLDGDLVLYRKEDEIARKPVSLVSNDEIHVSLGYTIRDGNGPIIVSASCAESDWFVSFTNILHGDPTNQHYEILASAGSCLIDDTNAITIGSVIWGAVVGVNQEGRPFCAGKPNSLPIDAEASKGFDEKPIRAAVWYDLKYQHRFYGVSTGGFGQIGVTQKTSNVLGKPT